MNTAPAPTAKTPADLARDAIADANCPDDSRSIYKLADAIIALDARLSCIETYMEKHTPFRELSDPTDPGLSHPCGCEQPTELRYCPTDNTTARYPCDPISSPIPNQTEQEEVHRMQLAAISTATLQNSDSTIKDRIDGHSPYWSPAYADTCRAVDREMNHRKKVEELWACLKFIKANLNEYTDFNAIHKLAWSEVQRRAKTLFPDRTL
jgi:hypothetical protein